jgi:hypothetical protein
VLGQDGRRTRVAEEQAVVPVEPLAVVHIGIEAVAVVAARIVHTGVEGIKGNN